MKVLQVLSCDRLGEDFTGSFDQCVRLAGFVTVFDFYAVTLALQQSPDIYESCIVTHEQFPGCHADWVSRLTREQDLLCENAQPPVTREVVDDESCRSEVCIAAETETSLSGDLTNGCETHSQPRKRRRRRAGRKAITCVFPGVLPSGTYDERKYFLASSAQEVLRSESGNLPSDAEAHKVWDAGYQSASQECRYALPKLTAAVSSALPDVIDPDQVRRVLHSIFPPKVMSLSPSLCAGIPSSDDPRCWKYLPVVCQTTVSARWEANGAQTVLVRDPRIFPHR